MAKHTFTSEEVELLHGIAARFSDSAASMDDDTKNAIEKIKQTSGEVELTDLERIGLHSIVSTTLAIAEVTPEPEMDAAALKSLSDKLQA